MTYSFTLVPGWQYNLLFHPQHGTGQLLSKCFISQLRLNFAAVTKDLINLVNYISQGLFLSHVTGSLQVNINSAVCLFHFRIQAKEAASLQTMLVSWQGAKIAEPGHGPSSSCFYVAHVNSTHVSSAEANRLFKPDITRAGLSREGPATKKQQIFLNNNTIIYSIS